MSCLILSQTAISPSRIFFRSRFVPFCSLKILQEGIFKLEVSNRIHWKVKCNADSSGILTPPVTA